MMELVEVGAGAVVGAPLRYMVDQVVNSRTRAEFPWGTYVINATGAFLLGLLTGLALYHGMGDVPSLVLGTGFCGAYTTFSTFSWESFQLVENGAPISGLYNVAGSLVVSLLLAAAGMALAYAI